MSFFAAVSADTILINRLDISEILGTSSAHGFDLEDEFWPSAEHYYQASKYQGKLRDKIRACDHPDGARKLGRRIFQRKRGDWKKVKDTVMTRAVYCKCKTHDEVKNALLETANQPLANNAYGEYYWGIGRDGRGENRYGKILQNVRERLREEMKIAEASINHDDA